MSRGRRLSGKRGEGLARGCGVLGKRISEFVVCEGRGSV